MGGKSSTRTCVGGLGEWGALPRVGARHGQEMLALPTLLAVCRPETETAQPRRGVIEPAEGSGVAGAAAHQGHAQLVLPAHLQVEHRAGRRLALCKQSRELHQDLRDVGLRMRCLLGGFPIRLQFQPVAARAVHARRDRGPARADREERPGGLAVGVSRGLVALPAHLRAARDRLHRHVQRCSLLGGQRFDPVQESLEAEPEPVLRSGGERGVSVTDHLQRRARRAAAGLPDHEGSRHPMDLRRHLAACHQVEDEGGGAATRGVEGLAHRRQCRADRRRRLDVVEADHRLVVRQIQPRLRERPHEAQRVVVGGCEGGGGWHARGEHRPPRLLARPLQVVGGLEEEARVRLDAVVDEGLPVGLVALPRVLLKQAAHEGDAAVTVLDKVAHGLEDPDAVVCPDHRAGEALHLLAEQDHGLAGVAQGLQVGAVDRVHHHDESGHLRPGRPEAVVRHQGVEATLARVEGLDRHQPAIGPGDRVGDRREHGAHVAAGDQWRQDPDPELPVPPLYHRPRLQRCGT